MKKVIFVFLATLAMTITVACSRAPAQGVAPTDTSMPSSASAATPIPTEVPVPTPIFVPEFIPEATPVPTETPQPTPTEIPAQTQEIPAEKTPDPVVIPAYTAVIELSATWGGCCDRGDAFLINGERGLFATNAHIAVEMLREDRLSRLWVDGVWYPVRASEDWINWWADAAIVRVEDASGLSLPENAVLGEVPEGDSRVRVAGYIRSPEDIQTPGAPLVPYLVDATVIFPDSEMSFIQSVVIARAFFLDDFLMSQPEGAETFEIPKELRSEYYRHYVVIGQEQPTPSQMFRNGTSGMTVATEEGIVVAMISKYFGSPWGGPMAFAIPAKEIEKLLEQVIGMLE